MLQEESEANGLGNLWSLSKKRFAANIAKWKKCGTYSSATGALYDYYHLSIYLCTIILTILFLYNSFLICFSCHFSQGYTAFGLVKEYLNVAHQKDPVFYARVLPKYVKKCALPNPDELTEKFDDAASIVEGMNCVVSVGDEKLTAPDYESIWRPIKMFYSNTIRDFGVCRTDK